MKRKYAVGITATACAAAIAYIWSFGVSRADDERRDAIDRTLRVNANLAGAYEQGASATLDAARATLRSVAHLRSAGVDDVGVLGRALAGPLLEIGMLDPRGALTLATGGRCVATMARSEIALKAADSGAQALRIGSPERCASIGKQVIPLALRIEREGQFVGVAIAALDASALLSPYASAELPRGGVLGLIGDDGVALVLSDAQGSRLSVDERGSPVVAARLRTPVGIAVGASPRGAAAHYYAYRTLEEFPLTVAVGTSAAETLAPATRRRLDIYLTAAMASTLLLAAAGVFVRFLSGGWAAEARGRNGSPRAASLPRSRYGAEVIE